MTTTFECNTELENILLAQGFAETSSLRDKIKGKKEFRFRNTSTKLHFDYMNLKLIEGLRVSEEFGSSAVQGKHLKLLLWYLNSDYADRKEISESGFSVQDALHSYQAINQELSFYVENDLKSRKLNKLKRLIDGYNKIPLS
ncbi:MAG: hypothetical protein K2Q33_01940 [Gammaproteobacteria bacterium]|nr:hypothetical protein [Gammaproteobacteria bacterium]